MKTDPNKSHEELPETKREGKLFEKAVFGKGTVKSLTMLDIIGLVVLTTFQPVLSHELPTENDSPRRKLGEKPEILVDKE